MGMFSPTSAASSNDEYDQPIEFSRPMGVSKTDSIGSSNSVKEVTILMKFSYAFLFL